MSRVSLLIQQLITVVIACKLIILIFEVTPGQALKESCYSLEGGDDIQKEQDANDQEKFPVNFTLTATFHT